VGDKRLEPTADIQMPSTMNLGTPTETGPIQNVLASWQQAPPNNSGSYALYRTTTTENVDGSGAPVVNSLWIESGTRFSLRHSITVNGQPSSVPRCAGQGPWVVA